VGSLFWGRLQSVALVLCRWGMILSITAMLLVDGTMCRPSHAQPATPPANAGERELKLTLVNAVQLAVQHNLDIEQARFGPKIARTDVETARAVFDPVVGTEASVSQTKVLPTTEVGVFNDQGELVGVHVVEPFSKDSELTPFLRHKIITGGSYELRFVNTQENVAPAASGISRTIADPRYESGLELSFTQPLLRDFGIAVNKAPIRRAEKSEAIAHQQVIQAILDVVFQVQERYWDMVFRLQDLDAKRESQKLAEDFLAENKIRVELGTLAPIELVQAETQVKIREEDVIVAEAAVQEAEDALKEVINIPEVLDSWNIHLHPTDKPTFEPIAALVVEDKLREALLQRPDIIESQLSIESREIARAEALNQRLPKLDLEARGSLNSFGNNVGKGLSNLSEINGYAWLFGLQFEYPLGNRAARNNVERRKLELRQALVAQRRLQLTIVREVRQAVRGIETASKRVEVTRAATKLARTQLEAEQEKFRLGLSTSFRVLEFQRELTDARSSETQALSDYNVELGRLDLRTGKLRYVDYQADGG
jgi:outer membrane protein